MLLLICAILLLQIPILALMLFALHKTRCVHLKVHAIEQNLETLGTKRLESSQRELFRQLEALVSLYADLSPTRSLPPTRGFAASPDFLSLLTYHTLQEKPQTVVECGSGTSTVVLALCMRINGGGHVYSLEEDSQYAVRTRTHLRRQELDDWATVIDAPLIEYELNGAKWLWYDLSKLVDSPYDLVVVDGPRASYQALARYPAGPLLFRSVSPDAAIFVDDSNREGERSILDRWCSEHPEFREIKLPCEKGCSVLLMQAEKAPEDESNEGPRATEIREPNELLQ